MVITDRLGGNHFFEKNSCCEVRKIGSRGLYKCMMPKEDIEQIFRSNYRAMLLLANRMVHDEDAARDIVHDVFASLLSGRASAVTPSYLLSGVHFACLKYIRSLSVRERLNKMYALDLSEIEDEEWPDEEAIAQIHKIVDRDLSELTRRIVMLRFCDRLTYSEIAEETGVSEVSVYKHLHHAMIVLRQNFNGNER